MAQWSKSRTRRATGTPAETPAPETETVAPPTPDAPVIMTPQDVLQSGQTLGLTFEQLKELMSIASRNTDEAIEKEAAANAAAQKAIFHPENTDPPRVSAYNPQGDRDFPRPELRIKFHWVGIELLREQLTREEILFLNVLQPGDYRVQKSDGTRIPLEVKAITGNDGNLKRLSVLFPSEGGEQQHNHGSMVSYLRQVVAQQPTGAETVKALDAELAAVPVPVAS